MQVFSDVVRGPDFPLNMWVAIPLKSRKCQYPVAVDVVGFCSLVGAGASPSPEHPIIEI
jgi:hypothetical protein